MYIYICGHYVGVSSFRSYFKCIYFIYLYTTYSDASIYIFMTLLFKCPDCSGYEIVDNCHLFS